ncbi:MAG: cobalt ECF transporter T component CbiQ [Muribaculaceae bacterium]|nr:cobalt ECF transporter T component CbiQ [Muribaculaceae bacterium]
MSLQSALITLNRLESRGGGISVDCRFQITVLAVYLVAVLSVPLTDPGMLVWMFVYPIVMSEACGAGYGRVALKSLWVLPLVALVGIFNPLLDHAPAWEIFGVTVSRGWVTFISICLRGILALQAVLALIYSTGFYSICTALRRMGMPTVLATQLLMVYRYISVLLQEAQSMGRARAARGFGRKNYPLRQWATMVGQLLLRSVARSQRIHRAMLARGFNGTMPAPAAERLRVSDWLFLIGWLGVTAVLRFVDLSSLLGNLL